MEEEGDRPEWFRGNIIDLVLGVGASVLTCGN